MDWILAVAALALFGAAVWLKLLPYTRTNKERLKRREDTEDD